MTLQQIEAFLSVSALLSFNKAARVNYTSPATVTRQIAALEKELGVQLLQRDTHSVRLTDEGKLFSLRAMAIVGEMNQYRENLMAVGRLPRDRTPTLRVASYTSDSMYRLLVDRIQRFPADWLGKQIRFLFPVEGQMVRTVLDGAADIGVESREYLRRSGAAVEQKLFNRSPFRLLAGKRHPLFGRRSISVPELLGQFGAYGDYIPRAAGLMAVQEKPVRSAEELRELGEFTISQLPRIIPLLGLGRDGRENDTDDFLLLLPRELVLSDFERFGSVSLEGEPIATEYMLFWKREAEDADLRRFLEMADFDPDALHSRGRRKRD